MKTIRRLCLFLLVIAVGCVQGSGWENDETQAFPSLDTVTVYAPTSTVEAVVSIQEVAVTLTKIPVLVNPYYGRIWNQRCSLVKKAEGSGIVVECEEEWARESLPGGCDTGSTLNYRGYASCTATSLAYVINTLLTPEEIVVVTGGTPGVTPNYLIDEIYPKFGMNLSCDGVSDVGVLRGVLELFGLQTRSASVSKYTLAKHVLSNEMAMVGISAVYEGQYLEHWTVFDGVQNNHLVFADSLMGKGNKVAFDDISELKEWEIISLLIVSKSPH